MKHRRGALIAIAVTLVGLVLLDRSVAFWPRYRQGGGLERPLSEMRYQLRSHDNVFLKTPLDFPFTKAPDEFVIGVFGGSVASNLAEGLRSDELLAQVAGARTLAKQLGRKVRVANLAISGGSEPGQYNMFRLFHDSIDAAVFLDGFNDLFNGSHFESPERPEELGCSRFAEDWRHGTRTPAERLAPLIADHEALVERMSSPWVDVLAHSRLYRAYLLGVGQDLSMRAAQFYQSLALPTGDTRGNGSLPMAKRIDRWSGCNERAVEDAASLGVPIFLFLQPNQYVEGSKTFSAEERQCCLYRRDEVAPEQWELQSQLRTHYAEMSRRLAELRARGVPAESLQDVFRDTPGTVYGDKCCHLNDDGNRIVAEAIFARLVERLR